MRKAEDILETYLAQIASGAAPQAPGSGLEPMLRVAMQLREVGAIGPSPARVERIRVALRRVPAREIGGRASAPRLDLWRRPVVGLAFAVLLLTLGTTSALAAPSALPDSPLYAVRNLREAVEIRLAATPGERASLYVTFAQQRADQLVRAARGKGASLSAISTLLADISSRTDAADGEARDEGAAARAALQHAEGQIAAELTQLQNSETLPPDANQQLDNTIRDVQPSPTNGTGPALEPTPTPEATPSAEATSAPVPTNGSSSNETP
jgi:hypothetical protein